MRSLIVGMRNHFVIYQNGITGTCPSDSNQQTKRWKGIANPKLTTAELQIRLNRGNP